MLDTLLAPFDYPRQAVANLGRGLGRAFSGEATADDYLGMLPGAIGGAAGLAGLGPIGMAIAASLGQGVGKATGMEAFNAPTTQDVLAGIGGDPDSMLQNIGAQLATDPLTYAGAAAPLFGGRMGARKIGGFLLPEAPMPTANQGFMPPKLPGAMGRPVPGMQGMLEIDAAAMAKQEELARILGMPPQQMTGARSPFMPPEIEAMMGQYGDMIADNAPFHERLGLAEELPPLLRANYGATGDVPPQFMGNMNRMASELDAGHVLMPRDAGFDDSIGVLGGPEPFNVGMRSGLTSRALSPHLAGGPAELAGPGSVGDRAYQMMGYGTSPMAPEAVNPLLDELANTAGMQLNRDYALKRYLEQTQHGLGSYLPSLGNVESAGALQMSNPMSANWLQGLLGMEGMEAVHPEVMRIAQAAGRGPAVRFDSAGLAHDTYADALKPLIEQLMGQVQGRTGM
jgi:hypothetical protein